MPRFIILLLLATAVNLCAQQRFFVRSPRDDLDRDKLIATFNGAVPAGRIERVLDFPNLQLNAISATLTEEAVGELINQLNVAYGQNNYTFAPEVITRPNDTTVPPIDPTAPTAHPGLDFMVPDRPITSPPIGKVTGDILVDLVGTGIDYSHPDLKDMDLVPPLSVMPASTGGLLPGDIDFHNHETRLAGCIGGLTTGLLTALGTTDLAKYRSVLCYDKPTSAGAVTYTSDCIAAIASIIAEHEARLGEPYLKNHAAVMCFAHSVETINTRVGDLDSLFDDAWIRGIFTSISAGNDIATAAASSPAGAGEWIIHGTPGSIMATQYWPPPGIFSYALPPTVGFETSMPGSDFHLKSGAHDLASVPAPWVDLTVLSLGSNLNNPNPLGFGPGYNHGVDVFTPGEDLPVPATQLCLTFAPGDPTIEVDATTYGIEKGYQVVSGTSYSAAYTAALATRIYQLRPWASPDQVRTAIIDASTSASPPDPQLLVIPDLSTLDPMSLSYDDWLIRYANIAPENFFAGGLDAELADADADGIPNITEYHCGMDPRYPDTHHAPVVTFNASNFSIEVKMQLACYLPRDSSISWEFQGSENLIDWDPLGQGTIVPLGETLTSGDGIDIKAKLPIIPDEVVEFFRVVIFSTP